MQQGRVKWFNAKAGYGFVTLLGGAGEKSNGVDPREVFVHHSGLRVSKSQFRYLVEGEYVELEVKEMVSEGGPQRYQGSEVRGIGGGMLMCETRMETSASTSEYKTVSKSVPRSEQVSRSEQASVPRSEKEGRKERPQKRENIKSVVQQMRHHTPKMELE